MSRKPSLFRDNLKQGESYETSFSKVATTELDHGEIFKEFPDLEEKVNFTRDFVKVLAKAKAETVAKKQIEYENALSLQKLLSFGVDYKNKACMQIIGNELADEQAVILLIYYMDILTNEGKDYPLKDEDKYNYDCLRIIRSLFWNYSDASYSFCLELGKIGLLPRLMEDLRMFQKTYKNDEKKRFIVRSAMGILHNCASYSDNLKYFHGMNIISTIAWYAKNTGKSVEDGLTTSSMMLLSYIVDEKNNDIFLADESIIKTLLELLAGAVDSDDKHCHGYSTVELVRGMSRLANNKKNSKAIVKNGILVSLIKLMECGNEQEKVTATKAVWAFSFENRASIKTCPGLMEILYSFVDSADEKLKNTAKYALWVLEKIDQEKSISSAGQEQSVQTNGTPLSPSRAGGHVMISYNWDCQELMIKVKEKLQALGYNTWMDIDNITGSTLESMAKAVENSAVIVICVSQKYQNSMSCRTEGEYAYQRRTPIVPVIVENGYKADNWLGAILGTKLYYNISTPEKFKKNFPGFVKELGERGKMEAPVVPTVVHPESAPAQGISVRNWTSNDVSKWLKDNDIHNIDGQCFDGEVLLFLKEIKRKAPEFFFKCISQPSKLEVIRDVMKFSNAFSDFR